MTAVLDNIRRLEAEYRRGHMSKEEFQRTREYLLASVEDVELVAPPEPVLRHPIEGAELWHVLAFLILGAAGSTLVGTWLFGDLNLALTVSAVLMAAVAVRACQKFLD